MNRDWTQDVVRYPDPAIEVIQPSFEQYVLGSAALERIYTGARWCEGPVWFGDGRYLLWSDIPNNRILRWDEQTGAVSVFRQPSNYTNGHTRDRQGRLISCEHDTRRVTRTEHDGTITVLMDRFEGKRLNAPNDVVVHPDGHIWFTDPGYGILMNYEGHKAEFELPTNVYRLNPHDGRSDRRGRCAGAPQRALLLARLQQALSGRHRPAARVRAAPSDLGLRRGRRRATDSRPPLLRHKSGWDGRHPL